MIKEIGLAVSLLLELLSVFLSDEQALSNTRAAVAVKTVVSTLDIFMKIPPKNLFISSFIITDSKGNE